MQIEAIDPNMCPISLDTYNQLRENNSLVCTPCNHLFRDMDLMQWLTIDQSCPICRAVVRLDDINYGDTPKTSILTRITAIFKSIITGVKSFFEELGKCACQAITHTDNPPLENFARMRLIH